MVARKAALVGLNLSLEVGPIGFHGVDVGCEGNEDTKDDFLAFDLGYKVRGRTLAKMERTGGRRRSRKKCLIFPFICKWRYQIVKYTNQAFSGEVNDGDNLRKLKL